MASLSGWLTDNWQEVLGAVTGLVCVWLAALRNVATFPIGIVNNIVFAWLFLGVALYAEAGLQVVYLILGVHGWMAWSCRRDHDVTRSDDGFVRRTPTVAIAPLLAAGIAGTALLAWLLHAATDSTTPWPDAATTAFSLVAQYMLNRRWLETWLVWIAVDVALVALLIHKGLLITAGLYGIFIMICVFGFLRWRSGLRSPASV